MGHRTTLLHLGTVMDKGSGETLGGCTSAATSVGKRWLGRRRHRRDRDYASGARAGEEIGRWALLPHAIGPHCGVGRYYPDGPAR
jgi:hypothetical protein